MKFNPPLQPATLLKRYKRFLVDVETPEKGIFTVHCANTGAMTGCAEPESTAWLSISSNPKRKYRHSLELVQTTTGHWIGVNTGSANKLVNEALKNNKIAGLENCQIQSEVTIGDSRLDFQVTKEGVSTYIEVKSVTLGPLGKNSGKGYFPDAVSVRAKKHLTCLSKLALQGESTMLLFCVQHSGITEVHPANHIDPDYGDMLKKAYKDGVKIKAYNCLITPKNIDLQQEIPVIIN